MILPDVPPGHAPALLRAAEEHDQALAPATFEQIERALIEMRSSLHRRKETEQEAVLSWAALVRELAQTPNDILREACRLYVRTERFFPRSPAELLEHVNPMLALRRRRAMNLRRLAEQSRSALDRKHQIESAPLPTDDDLRELANNPLIAQSTFDAYVARGWATQQAVDRILKEVRPDPDTAVAD